MTSCTGPACVEYSSCESFYNEQVCPTVFEALGGAAGYASALFGALASAHALLAKRKCRKNGSPPEDKISIPAPPEAQTGTSAPAVSKSPAKARLCRGIGEACAAWSVCRWQAF